MSAPHDAIYGRTDVMEVRMIVSVANCMSASLVASAGQTKAFLMLTRSRVCSKTISLFYYVFFAVCAGFFLWDYLVRFLFFAFEYF